MRSDPEQEDAWRDEVRAFRRAVQGLADPALPLFKALTRAEEYVARLIVQLPLTTFSPFDALPDVALDEARKPADPIPRPGRLAPGIGARTVSRASEPTPSPARPSKALHPG